MTVSRCLPLVVACLVSGVSLAASPGGGEALALPAPYKAPYTPAVDSEILQQVPSASDPTVRLMTELRARLTADPTNLMLADQLARAYIDFGRQLGDAHYAGYGEAVMAPWMAKKPPPPVAMVLQATILQFRHQFAEARVLLNAAVQRDPQNAQAWLTLANLDMVQGEYAAAGKNCSQVARTGGMTLSLACTGNLRSYVGQAQQSVALLTQISDDGPTVPATFKAWIHGLIAESQERLGNWSEVEAHYRKALASTPEDNFLQVAYADFLLDRGRPKDVLTLLANSAQSDTAFLRIALAQAALQSPETSRYTWVMAARFEALTQRGDDFFGREQVRFALHLQHDPATALDLAQRNWQVQRAPWDVRVFLEAALAAKKPNAAVPVLAFLDETKLQDPIIEPMAQALRAQLKTTQGRAQ